MGAVGDGWYSEGKKVEVVTTYMILGNAAETARVCGIPAGTLHRWKTEPWWKELVDQIQQDDNQELDAKLAKRINKALELVQDRMDNGDFVIMKNGEVLRKPVSLKDTWKVNKEMIDVRLTLRKEKAVEANQEAVSDILKTLAKEFADMAKSKIKDKEPVEAETPKANGT